MHPVKGPSRSHVVLDCRVQGSMCTFSFFILFSEALLSGHASEVQIVTRPGAMKAMGHEGY